MQNLTSDSCSATPISYKGDEMSRLSRPVIEFPIAVYLECLGDFGGLRHFGCKIRLQILARRPRFVIKATKYRAYLAQLSSSPLRCIWGVWGILGDLGTLGAKSVVRFLLGDPDLL